MIIYYSSIKYINVLDFVFNRFIFKAFVLLQLGRVYQKFYKMNIVSLVLCLLCTFDNELSQTIGSSKT